MSDYYMLECYEPDDWDDSALLRAVPLPAGEQSWRFGRPFATSPPVPIPVEMVDTHCDRLMELYNVDALLMTRRLAEALADAGVDNIDFYDTLVRHPETGFESRDYVAGNLIGLVAAADLSASTVVGGSSSGLIDVDFESVAVDPGKTHGLLMFRLAENTSAVVVHRKVKEHLERLGFAQLAFVPPEAWMG